MWSVKSSNWNVPGKKAKLKMCPVKRSFLPLAVPHTHSWRDWCQKKYYLIFSGFFSFAKTIGRPETCTTWKNLNSLKTYFTHENDHFFTKIFYHDFPPTERQPAEEASQDWQLSLNLSLPVEKMHYNLKYNYVNHTKYRRNSRVLITHYSDLLK